MQNILEYRIGTRYNRYTDVEIINNKLSEEGWREYLLIELYYDFDYDNPIMKDIIDGITPDVQPPIKPVNYAESNLLKGWNNLQDLSDSYNDIKRAFKKPLIDLDHFPMQLVNDLIKVKSKIIK